MNQSFYTRLDITDDEQLRPRLAEPFATIIREAETDDEGGESLQEHDDSSHVEYWSKATSGGAEGTRTPNPLLAKQMRYQLRHGPERSL